MLATMYGLCTRKIASNENIDLILQGIVVMIKWAWKFNSNILFYRTDFTFFGAKNQDVGNIGLSVNPSK